MPYRKSMPSWDETAWFAGFFDGEGSISILRYQRTRKSGNTYLRYHLYVRISHCSETILEFIQDRWGGSMCKPSPPRTPRGHTIYHWSISANRAAHVLEEMLPYLKLKRKQAELALEFQQELRNSKYHYGGHPVPENRLALRDKEYEIMLLLKEPALQFEPNEIGVN